MRIIASLTLSSLLFAACTTSTPPADENANIDANTPTQESIKIGYIGPLTGDAASYGADTLNGVQLAVEELNGRGGILNGRMIELIAEDGRCNPSDAVSAVQKLTSIDNVVAIVGGQCSGETLAAAPIANASQTPLLSPISSSPDVTNAGDFVFRDYPSDALKTKAMAQYLKDKEMTRIAVITENTDFAVAFRDALKEQMDTDAFVFDEIVEPGTKDFRSLLTRLQDTEFDVFFPNGQSAAAIAAMMQQAREAGFTQLAVSHDVAQDKSTIELAGEAAVGMQVIGVPEVDASTPFAQKFTEQYGEPQGALAFVAHAYDAMYVLASVIDNVGTDGPAIRDALYNLDGYNGVVGRFSFDENGDVIGIPYVLYEAQDGAWTAVQDVTVE